MRKHKIAAFGAFAGLVLNSKHDPSMTTASIGLVLAIVFAVALFPLVREGLNALVD